MTTTCRGCGKPIVFATDRGSNRVIPLDPTPPIYRISEDGSCCRAERAHRTFPRP